MSFRRWFAVLLLACVPVPASAISLHWLSGTTDLPITQPTRCVLVLRADSAEVTLPSQWRLLWLADSSGINFVAEGSEAACASDTARVSTVNGPATPADSAAHTQTSQFCSAGSSPVAVAYFVLDQPAGSKGRLKVVALDPGDPDSNTVLESNEVTYNGGVEPSFPPAVLRASTVHRSTAFHLHAVGSGLTEARDLALAAPDGSWQVPPAITSQSDNTLVASAALAANVPPPSSA